MARSKPPAPDPVENILAALDDGLGMLGDYSVPDALTLPTEAPGSLLDQCLELCAKREATRVEPVRTLHHFACTGGTLISKCIAAMPNTQLLSEVDPLSTLLLDPRNEPAMTPTDLVMQMRQSTRGVSEGLIVDIFLRGLEAVHAETSRAGQRLVLRDHAHSLYCHGPGIPDRPGLRRIVASRFPVVSVLTVRHPIDSYLALLALGWISYAPRGLEEYSRRYLAFLEDHSDLAPLRYEDFIDEPQAWMRGLCDRLLLPYSADFASLFDAFQLTGDSGRGGREIRRRPRREIDESLAREAGQSPNYRRLCKQLGYDA
jgi:hypothetical protein